MRKKTGILLVVLGAVLLIAALLSVLYNEKRDERAGEEADKLLGELQQLIAQRREESALMPIYPTEPESQPIAADTDTEDTVADIVTDVVTDAVTETVTDSDNADVTKAIADTTAALTPQDTEAVSPTVSTPIADPAPINVNGHDCMGFIEIPSLGIALPVMSDWSDEKLDIAPCRHFGTLYGDDLVIAGHNFKRHFSYITRLKGDETVMFTDTDGVVHYYTVTAVRHVNSKDVGAVQNSGHDLVLYTCTFIGDIRSAVFCDRTV